MKKALIIAIVAAGIAVVAAYFSLNRAPSTEQADAFDTAVPPIYTEQGPIHVPARDLHCMTADNGLIVAADDAVFIYGYDGKEISKFSVFGAATAAAADGDIFLCMGNRIAVYSRAGKLLANWQYTDEKSMLVSISVRGNDVFTADYKNRIVWHYDRTGVLKGSIAGRDEGAGVPGLVLPSPYCDVVIDRAAVWVVNTGRLAVEKYTLSGKLLSSWGKPGVEPAQFPGCCNPAHIALIPSGGFITSEKGLQRIKEFDRAGNFVGLVTRPGAIHPSAKPPHVAVAGGRVYALDTHTKAVRVFERSAGGKKQ